MCLREARQIAAQSIPVVPLPSRSVNNENGGSEGGGIPEFAGLGFVSVVGNQRTRVRRPVAERQIAVQATGYECESNTVS